MASFRVEMGSRNAGLESTRGQEPDWALPRHQVAEAGERHKAEKERKELGR